jgi:hypothetical protein
VCNARVGLISQIASRVGAGMRNVANDEIYAIPPAFDLRCREKRAGCLDDRSVRLRRSHKGAKSDIRPTDQRVARSVKPIDDDYGSARANRRRQGGKSFLP